MEGGDIGVYEVMRRVWVEVSYWLLGMFVVVAVFLYSGDFEEEGVEIGWARGVACVGEFRKNWVFSSLDIVVVWAFGVMVSLFIDYRLGY